MPRRRLPFEEFQIGADALHRLDALTKIASPQPAQASTGGTGTGDMLKATYDTDTDGRVDQFKVVPNSAALPTAGSGNEGTFYYYRPSIGSPSQLFFCQRNSSGGYEWVPVTLST